MKKAILLIITLLVSVSHYSYGSVDIVFKKEKWELLSYSKIPANTVSFKDNKMNIVVKSSASPIIYPLKEAGKFRFLTVDAKVRGSLKLGKIQQGQKGADDFRLRIGLVYQGDQTLGFFKRKIAADWILKLYSLAPDGAGVSRIEFFNTYADAKLKGTKRPHPLADILKESFVLELNEGVVSQKIMIPNDANILALWISSDGDGTQSSFEVDINKISLSNE